MTFQPGFDFTEAKAMIALSQAIYGEPSPTPVQPPTPQSVGWSKVDALSPSGPTLLDNLWQIWQNDNNSNQYAIVVRGTVDTAPSILADLLFPLVDARNDLSVTLGGTKYEIPFNLARDEGDSAVIAGTHLGFTLGLLLMLATTDRPLLLTLANFAVQKKLGKDIEVFITGHSQGASVATLLTSFVRHASGIFADIAKVPFKTYVFAPAKPGNEHYGYDYDFIAGVKGLGWSVVSTQGWVPEAPFTLQGPWDLNTPNPLREFGGHLDLSLDPVAAQFAHKLEPSVASIGKDLVENAHRAIADLKPKITASDICLNASAFGGPETALADGSAISDLLDDFLKRIQLSLNFAYAGSLVPLFATPGGNPNNPKDYFWQHHLGNYWKYMDEQYGP